MTEFLYFFLHIVDLPSIILLIKSWHSSLLEAAAGLSFASFKTFLRLFSASIIMSRFIWPAMKLLEVGLGACKGEYHKKCTMVTGRCWLGRTTGSIPKVPLNNLL